jgi:hypothetical protein
LALGAVQDVLEMKYARVDFRPAPIVSFKSAENCGALTSAKYLVLRAEKVFPGNIAVQRNQILLIGRNVEVRGNIPAHSPMRVGGCLMAGSGACLMV